LRRSGPRLLGAIQAVTRSPGFILATALLALVCLLFDDQDNQRVREAIAFVEGPLTRRVEAIEPSTVANVFAERGSRCQYGDPATAPPLFGCRLLPLVSLPRDPIGGTTTRPIRVDVCSQAPQAVVEAFPRRTEPPSALDQVLGVPDRAWCAVQYVASGGRYSVVVYGGAWLLAVLIVSLYLAMRDPRQGGLEPQVVPLFWLSAPIGLSALLLQLGKPLLFLTTLLLAHALKLLIAFIGLRYYQELAGALWTIARHAYRAWPSNRGR
jgi:hypothetical protein